MYAFGLMGYRDNSFLTLTVPDFLVMVDGALNWQTEKEDRLFTQQSIFVAQIMLSSGNYKKNTDIDKMRKEVYLPLADRRKRSKSDNAKLQHVGKQKVNKLRAELQEKFNLKTE